MLLLKLIEIINQEIYETIGEKFYKEYPVCLKYQAKGYASEIHFAGIKVWSSEYDNRKLSGNGDGAEKEPLETHLRREVSRIADEIGKIKL